MGKPMVMGRKTFESLPGLLPGRRHIVLTRRERWDCEGADVVRSVDEAVALLDGEPASVIGGAAIFDVFLPIATRAELTEIHADFDGDVFMRPLPAGWQIATREDHEAQDGTPAFSFVTYERAEDTPA
jgi:dihydrofolate reductase